MSRAIIIGLIGATIAYVVMIGVAKSRKHSASSDLEYGWEMFAIGMVCMVISMLAASAMVRSDVFPITREVMSIVACAAGFGICAVYCLVEFFGVKGRYDQSGMSYRTPWRGWRYVTWRNLESIHFSRMTDSYVLRFADGEKLRISKVLKGHGELLELLERKVKPGSRRV